MCARLSFTILRATNLGSQTKWRRGTGNDDGPGLADLAYEGVHMHVCMLIFPVLIIKLIS